MYRFKIIIICFFACAGNLYGETEKIIINKIDLIGNKNVSVNEILFIVRQRPPTFFYRQPEFNSRLLKLDALTLKNYYHSKGFLDVKIQQSHKINDSKADIIFEIDEGRRYYLKELKINGNHFISNEKISELLGLSVGESYNPVAINENLYLLENEYYNIGKLFFTIDIKDYVTDSVAVVVDIEEEVDVYINNTFFEKTGNIDSTIIWRELTYKKGDLYTKKETDKTLKQLREMGIFSMANLIPVRVANSDSLVNLVIEFRRFKQREWYSTGGYDPISFAEGSPELPALSATIEWRNRAAFNTPKQFSTKLLAGFPMETDFATPRIRYDASFSSNWFINIRIPTTLTGYFERFIIYEDQKYNKSIDRFGVNLVQRIKLEDRSFIDNKIVWEEFSDKSETNIQERSVLSRIYLDYKDDPLYTKRGYLMDLIFKSTGFGGSREYFKTDVTMHSYYPMTRKSVFALRLQLGRMWKWDNNDPDYSYEKFYLGGSTSMRGWDVLKFNDTDGTPDGETIRLMKNIEIRTDIYKSIGLTLFVDGAILTDKMTTVSYPNIKWDAGLGLTIKTPLGPFRIDYAYRIKEKNESRIQLGVQNLF